MKMEGKSLCFSLLLFIFLEVTRQKYIILKLNSMIPKIFRQNFLSFLILIQLIIQVLTQQE